jgi:DNA-binding transcriptional regulator YiaG
MPAISPAELRRILDELDLTLAELAALCHVHPVSARRWGSTGVPDGPAVVLIRLLEAGDVTAKAIERASRKKPR